MGFIVEALANVLLEVVDHVILWICIAVEAFALDIGTGSSAFEQYFDSAGSWGTMIAVLAMLIVFLVTGLKLWQALLGPFATESEEPGVIAVRSILAGGGVIASYSLFKWFQAGFNQVYSLFTAKFEATRQSYIDEFGSELQKNQKMDGSPTKSTWQRFKDFLTNEDTTTMEKIKTAGKSVWKWLAEHATLQGRKNRLARENAKENVEDVPDAFLFGKNNFIKASDKMAIGGLPLLLVELFVGCTMLIAIMKLLLEIYERYVIIALLYYFCPLAFSALSSKSNRIFHNYIQMVVSQFILMCSNLFFLGVFIAGWQKILHGVKDVHPSYVFESSQQFITVMFLMIGWLNVGQKVDEMLRTAGLSAAQSGAGLGGEILSSMVLTRSVIGAAKGAGKFAGKTVSDLAQGKGSFANGINSIMGKKTDNDPGGKNAAARGGDGSTKSDQRVNAATKQEAMQAGTYAGDHKVDSNYKASGIDNAENFGKNEESLRQASVDSPITSGEAGEGAINVQKDTSVPNMATVQASTDADRRALKEAQEAKGGIYHDRELPNGQMVTEAVVNIENNPNANFRDIAKTAFSNPKKNSR